MFSLGEEFQRCQKKIQDVERAYKVTIQKKNLQILECKKVMQDLETLFSEPSFKSDVNTYVCFIHVEHTLLVAAFNLLQGPCKPHLPIPTPKLSFDAGFPLGMFTQKLEYIVHDLKEINLLERVRKLRTTCINNVSGDDIYRLKELQREAIIWILEAIEFRHR